MNDFYVLKPAGGIRFGKKWAYADLVDPVNRGDSEKCPLCNGPVSGRKWLPPLVDFLQVPGTGSWGLGQAADGNGDIFRCLTRPCEHNRGYIK
jgi:hypothetical protein